MDIDLAQKIADALSKNAALLTFSIFVFGTIAVTGYRGRWRFERELIASEAKAKSWEDRHDKLAGEFAAQQQQVIADARARLRSQ